MKAMWKRVLSVLLCAALALSICPMTGAATTGESDEKIVYGQAGAVTFVPEGYTYIFLDEDGNRSYSQVAASDMYISERRLTAEEAQALAALDYEGQESVALEDGTAITTKTFDARQAAAYSQAVQEILSGRSLEADDTVTLRLEAHPRSEKVPVLIVFEDEPVARMETMTVQVGTELGQKERSAMEQVVAAQQQYTRAMEKKLGYSIQVEKNFSLMVNAVSATVAYGDLPALQDMPGVKEAYLMPTFSVPDVQATAAEITPAMKYVGPGMGAAAAWDLGNRGEGMLVSVIDTGLYLENPIFAQAPADAGQVALSKEDVAAVLEQNQLHAQTLLEGVTVDSVYYSSKIPFGFDYANLTAAFGNDDNYLGHGTHVAGIVAGNLPEDLQEEYETATLGIAPEAQLLSMNVFDSSGGAQMDWILAALEDSVLLGADCINLSLGSANGPVWMEGVTEIYDAACEAGIHVVVSAGNEAFTGNHSLWGGDMVKTSSVSTGTVGMPGSFDSVLTVASVENSHVLNSNAAWGDYLMYTDSYGNSNTFAYQEKEDVPEGKTLRELYEGQVFSYATSLEDAEGKLLFAEFAGGDASRLAAEAKEAGAVGLVLYAPSLDLFYSYVDYTVTHYDLPVVSVMGYYAVHVLNRDVTKGKLTVVGTWNDSSIAGQMSSFSSWGPTDGLTLKPEITGIGGNVFSGWNDGFAVASGTSMASPAVAAAAVLVRQHLQKNGLEEDELNHAVNCLLMSTASPILDEERHVLYAVRRQGAGLANIGAALASEAYIQVTGTDKAKLELGDDPARTGVYEMSFEVVNFSQEQKEYTLDTTVLGQVAEGGQIVDGEVTYLTLPYEKELSAGVTSSLTDGTLTVPAGSTAQVTVTVTLSEADRRYMEERFPCGAYVEGFVQLLGKETPNLSVPFLAFYGDFYSAPILEDGTYESLLAGNDSYTTADQFHNSIWGYDHTMQYNNPDLGTAPKQRYLGQTNSGTNQYPYCIWDGSSDTLPFQIQKSGISPNGDNALDFFTMGLGLRRNAENIRYTVTNQTTGEVLWTQETGRVGKTYYNSTYDQVMYAGVYANESLSLDWLYPIYGETDFWGNVTYYYDTSTCLLPEDTQVVIQAEVFPENSQGEEREPEVIEFPLYIDTTTPLGSAENYIIESKLTDYGDYISTWMDLSIVSVEDWYPDYGYMAILEQDEDGNWMGGRISAHVYSTGVPGADVEPSAGFNLEFHYGTKSIMMVSDYAGNICMLETVLDESLLDYVELSAETTQLDVGQTLTIENRAENEYTIQLAWQTSDPEILEIVEEEDGSCTVRAVAPGTATISGGFGHCDGLGADGKLMRSVEIKVIDRSLCHQIELRNSKAPTCTEDGYSGDEVCTNCGETISVGEILPAYCPSSAFTDLDSTQWYHDYACYVLRNGLMKGTGATTFAPYAPLTRGQMVTILYRAAGEPEVTGASPFSDVVQGSYYEKAVIWAAEQNITEGVSATAFAPYADTTREQMVTFLYRFARLQGADVTATGSLEHYSDAEQVSPWAVDAMIWAVEQGIVHGTAADILNPRGVARRIQAAKVMAVWDQKF